jgi:acetyl-CoA acetyltransferase
MALKKAAEVEDIGLIEFNEFLASQALAVIRELDLTLKRRM